MRKNCPWPQCLIFLSQKWQQEWCKNPQNSLQPESCFYLLPINISFSAYTGEKKDVGAIKGFAVAYAAQVPRAALGWPQCLVSIPVLLVDVGGEKGQEKKAINVYMGGDGAEPGPGTCWVTATVTRGGYLGCSPHPASRAGTVSDSRREGWISGSQFGGL